MDQKFISDSLDVKVTKFAFPDLYFFKTMYKKEIQYLFSTFFFSINSSEVTQRTISTSSADIRSIKSSISILKRKNKLMFDVLFNYSKDVFGPGEVMLYYLIDDIRLAGKNSSGDLILSNERLECKAAKIKNQNQLYDFKLGGTFSTDEIRKELVDLGKTYGITGTTNSFPSSKIKMIKNKTPEFQELERKYAELAYDKYFSHYPIVFVSSDINNRGDLITIKDVKVEDIRIERITMNDIKPVVLL
jgi:hypothetical protein